MRPEPLRWKTERKRHKRKKERKKEQIGNKDLTPK